MKRILLNWLAATTMLTAAASPALAHGGGSALSTLSALRKSVV